MKGLTPVQERPGMPQILRTVPRYRHHAAQVPSRWGAALRIGGILCCLLTVLAVTPAVVRSAEQAEIWVDDDYHPGTPGWGVSRFASLTNGLNAIEAGGLIHLSEGLYHGPFTLNKPGVRLVGEGQAANVILHGNGASYAVSITANMISLTPAARSPAPASRVCELSRAARTYVAGCRIEGERLCGAGDPRRP